MSDMPSSDSDEDDLEQPSPVFEENDNLQINNMQNQEEICDSNVEEGQQINNMSM